MEHPTRLMARPTVSDGPAGAVVEAINNRVGLARSKCSMFLASGSSCSTDESTKAAETPNRSRRVRMMPSNNDRARSPRIGSV